MVWSDIEESGDLVYPMMFQGFGISSILRTVDEKCWVIWVSQFTSSIFQREGQNCWHSSSRLVQVGIRIKMHHLSSLVGAQPPPYCSFARHLVGKMVIHCSFAHL